MAGNYSFLAVAGTFAAVFFLIGRRILGHIEDRQFARAHGCKPGRSLPQSERILGIGTFKEAMAVSKAKRVLADGQEKYAEFGNTHSLIALGKSIVTTIEPQNVKTVLSLNFNDYTLGRRLQALGVFLGLGIFTSDGANWQHSRALVRPSFTKDRVADLDTFETHIQNLMAKIPKDGRSVDLQKLFFQLTLDSATEFLLGESMHTLTSPEGSPQQLFGQSFDNAQNVLPTRLRLGPFVKYFHHDKKFKADCRFVHESVDRLVQKALHRSGKQPTTDGKHNEHIEKYVFVDELVKATRDPIRIRSEVLNLLLAGRDTTAGLLSNTFWILARRPDIWDKLTAEINELGGEKPNYETLRNLKYLKYVLHESLRLFPSVPNNGRFANKNTTLPVGGGEDGQSPLFIPKGTLVAWSTYSMHRRKDIYGEDAEEYRPERWETLRVGWEFLPFNGGPRICIGQQFALTEAGYTIVRMVQEFGRIESRDERPWVEGLHLTLSSGNPVGVAMFPRR